MNIQDLNDLSNEVLVARITSDNANARIDEIMAGNEEVQALQAIIASSKIQKEQAQTKLIEAMKSNDLKSWKTEQANFARTKRTSVKLDPSYKKTVEGRLKLGEEVEGFSLNETEYMSIKINK